METLNKMGKRKFTFYSKAKLEHEIESNTSLCLGMLPMLPF